MEPSVLVPLVAVSIGLAVAAFLSRRFWLAHAETRRIRALFSRYVPPVVVDEILARKDTRIFEGRERFATVLYCRIWNFSLFSENLTPDETLRYLNEFYTVTGKSIQKHRGMIDKFLGDGIMGVFGMPLSDPFKEEHAIRAALDIIRLVDGMDARWRTQGRQALRIGIGINSGTVIAGDTGFLDRREYAVVGSESIVAGRLQEATEELGASILVSANTYEPARHLFTGVPVGGGVPLRGMRRVQPAYVISGLVHKERESTPTIPARSFRQTTIAREGRPLDVIAGKPAQPEPTLKAPTAAPRPAPAPPPAEPPPARPAFALPLVEPVNREYSIPLDLPELRSPRLRTFDDDRPAMPEPPPPSVTYEDKDGPPLQLPP